MSDKGLQVTENKVEAVAAAPKPKNAAEVRGVLGSALFSYKFIPTRTLLSLQQYSFKIKYIPGWKKLADGLSRLPIDGTETESGVGVEEYALLIQVRHAIREDK